MEKEDIMYRGCENLQMVPHNIGVIKAIKEKQIQLTKGLKKNDTVQIFLQNQNSCHLKTLQITKGSHTKFDFQRLTYT